MTYMSVKLDFPYYKDDTLEIFSLPYEHDQLNEEISEAHMFLMRWDHQWNCQKFLKYSIIQNYICLIWYLIIVTFCSDSESCFAIAINFRGNWLLPVWISRMCSRRSTSSSPSSSSSSPSPSSSSSSSPSSSSSSSSLSSCSSSSPSSSSSSSPPSQACTMISLI